MSSNARGDPGPQVNNTRSSGRGVEKILKILRGINLFVRSKEKADSDEPRCQVELKELKNLHMVKNAKRV